MNWINAFSCWIRFKYQELFAWKELCEPHQTDSESIFSDFKRVGTDIEQATQRALLDPNEE